MKRPAGYQYIEILHDHLGGDFSQVFNGEMIYPRQLEVHLPGDGKRPCDFHCFYCQGRILEQPLGRWEETGLRLIEKLEGAIPYFIYGGAYTEPLLNAWLPDYLKLTKKFSNNFGIHTNGSRLLQEGLCPLLARLADSPLDYVSVSLDAGTPKSHAQTKHAGEEWFGRIIEGIRELVRLRGDKEYPVVRVCYLMNKFNSSAWEISAITALMKEVGVDSLRFSVPYALYGQHFDRVRKYRHGFEVPFGERCVARLAPYLSEDAAEKPLIFWHPPGFQDVEKMTFRQCIYSYYQITLGADGWVYRCSSAASPTFAPARLGKITDDLDEFSAMVMANHNPDWDAGKCFGMGARCNRIALEINSMWAKRGLK